MSEGIRKKSRLACKVITVSDTRTKATDRSGALICELLEHDGHEITAYEIVRDEEQPIRDAALAGCDDAEVDAVLLTGGTGIAPRDVTVEVIEALLDKKMPGFGELFRMLSYTEDIGSAAMLSRATAGGRNGTAVFSMPGSSGAVRLAMNRLILPELRHVAAELHK
ncbi:MAG TPA: MogA/MoaB family molybdenum cofactor biosynthesis protein [Bacillales bacterium]|nr:MogA/MoaB family molybdenum cofactor biosynthesis protein [Bacillales bacterium]